MLRLMRIFYFLIIILLKGCTSLSNEKKNNSNSFQQESSDNEDKKTTRCEEHLNAIRVKDLVYHVSSSPYQILRGKIWSLNNIDHCNSENFTSDTARVNFNLLKRYINVPTFAFYTDGTMLFHLSIYNYKYSREDDRLYLTLLKQNSNEEPIFFEILDISENRMLLFGAGNTHLRDTNPNDVYSILNTGGIILELSNTGRKPVDE